MPKFNLANKIKGLLKSKKLEQFKVSPEFDSRLLDAVQKHKSEQEIEKSHSYFNILAHIAANAFKKYAVATVAIVLLVLGGIMYYNQNSYAYYLNKAKSALAQLEAAISDSSHQATLIPVAIAQAEDGSSIDEEQVADLTEEVVEETEAAIEAAEEMSDPEDLEEALEEISELQEEEIEVFADAAEVVESEMTTEVVAEALETTLEEYELVGNALEFVEDAVEAGEEVNIDIETSEDKEGNERMVKAEERLEEAQAALEELKELGADEEEIQQLEDKMAKIEAALEEGKAGRAFGLSTAMQAQSRHMLKKTEEDEHLKRAEERFEEAKKALARLKEISNGNGEIKQLEERSAKVEDAFEEGKIGKAFGLSTAIKIQSIYKFRKSQNKASKRDGSKNKNREGQNGEEDEEKGDIHPVKLPEAAQQ